MGKRKNNTLLEQPSYKSAVKRYRNESGELFQEPSREHSTFEQNSWLLNDATGLVAIVPADGQRCLFHHWLSAHLIQIALEH